MARGAERVSASFIDEVRALTAKPGMPCPLEAALAAIPDLADVLADETIQASAISRALARRGHKVADEQIRKHRRSLCRCAR